MRRFHATIYIENDCETLAEGLQSAKQTLSDLGLKVYDVKPVISRRSENQNSALWLFFTQLAEELNNKGLDMRKVVRNEIDIPWTKNSVHDYLWVPVQKAMYAKDSTTKLSRGEEINAVYDVLNRAITERTQGEIRFPPFPSLEILIDANERIC